MQLFYAKSILATKRLYTWQNCQKWPPSKGYRLAKILYLGQKLKMHKNTLKTFIHHIAVVLSKNRLQKTAIIRKHFLNIQKWPPSKGYTPKDLTLGQKLKMRKNMLKRFYNTLQLFYAKNGSKKQLIFEK